MSDSRNIDPKKSESEQPEVSQKLRRLVAEIPPNGLSFTAGALLSFIVMAALRFPATDSGSPFLQTPFLGFVGCMIFGAAFYAPVCALLARGAISIKWGDKLINLAEIEANVQERVDEEGDSFDSKLSDLADEVEELKRRMEGEDQPASDKNSDNVIEEIKSSLGIQNDDLAEMIYHLGTSKYRWRKGSTLESRCGFDSEKVSALAKSMPQLVVRGKSSKGNTIYRLTDEAMAKLPASALKS